MTTPLLVKTTAIISFFAIASIAAVSFTAGYFLAAPSPKIIGVAPADLNTQNVELPGHNNTTLNGWFVAVENPKAVLLLLHGIRSDRRDMLSRARFLTEAGYSVFLYDSRGHGESDGDVVTFGYLESLDAERAINFLQERMPGIPIGIIGMSLGGAAAVLGNAASQADMVILEAVYPDLITAIDNRLQQRLGSLSLFAKSLLLPQIKWRIGVSAQWFSPLERIKTLTTPTLIVAGAIDQHTTLEQSKSLFSAAAGPKELYVVEGAAHQNFHTFSRTHYELRVLQFIDQHLSSSPRY